MLIPHDILDALEAGELSESQLRRLIRIEAEELGLTYAEGVEQARTGTLPGCVIGNDLESLVKLLDEGE